MGHFSEFNPSMSNCHAGELRQVYEAIFKDASYAYPTLKAEFEKDLTRLLSLVEQRGIGVYLQDLPAVGKHLDRCLAGGKYILSGLPLTKRYSGRVVIPKFLRGLYLLVFHETGCLKDDYDIQAILFLRQILLMAKKAPFACSEKKVLNEIKAFYDVDVSLPEPDQVWVSNPTEAQFQETYHGYGKSAYYRAKVDVGSLSLSDERLRRDTKVFLGILDTVSSILTSSLGSYDPSCWTFKHGPGVVSEAPGCPEKYKLLQDGWDDLLGKSFPISSYGFHNFGSWARSIRSGSDRSTGFGSSTTSPFRLGTWVDRESPGSSGLSGEPGIVGEDRCLSSVSSRLISVPKDYRKPRLIAAEPCARLWCQQNVWSYFRGRVGGTWLSKFVRFRDQTRNQILCRRGSLDGSLCTVDLSAASDRVTCHAVGNFFRRNPRLLMALAACRTPILRQDYSTDVPSLIGLRKFSTMGNACTFPVETLLFLGIALASVLCVRGLRATTKNIRRLSREVSVFGDDIIIPADCRELFFAALEVLDFKVNTEKSFWTGKFRESCGVDAFDGVDVTPVYWKGANNDKPESLATAVECSNNFYKKFLLHSSRQVASTLPSVIPMVPMRSGAFGLKTRTAQYHNDLRGRWNFALQRVEVWVGTIISVQTRVPLSNGESALLQYFTEAPSPYDIWSSGTPQKPLTKFRKRWVAVEELVTQSN